MEKPTESDLVLVMTWISHSKAADAWDELNDLVADRPETAWRVIQEMVQLSPDNLTLAGIAAGPLEDLLHEHPEPFVSRAVSLAGADAKFQRCLDGVWGLEGAAEKAVERALSKKNTADRAISGSVARKRAALITRWFHHSDTSWADTEVRRLIATEPERAWRVLLLLVAVATDPIDEDVLDDVCTLVFALLVDKHSQLITPRVVKESKANGVIRGWIEARRNYAYIGPEWAEILKRARPPAS